MKSSVTIRKDLSILKIEEGVFNICHEDPFNSVVADLLAKEQSKNLLIDFSQVKAIDASVITSIRFAQEFANKNGGIVIFVSLCKPIKDLLKLQDLDRQLNIFSSVNEVMTLIAPDVKGKRAGRVKKKIHSAEIIDEIDLAVLEVIAIPDIHDDELDEDLDTQLIQTDDPVLIDAPTEKLHGTKKRGRPKSTAPLKAQ
ncbi:MAG: STAS domain-containing protein [Chlorobium sp.]|jgi:anti-anti-sigma regulatory factor|nr:MAG: STAS domain-containing protein [Chlorobium sp.]